MWYSSHVLRKKGTMGMTHQQCACHVPADTPVTSAMKADEISAALMASQPGEGAHK